VPVGGKSAELDPNPKLLLSLMHGVTMKITPVAVIKAIQLMPYREATALCLEIHTSHSIICAECTTVHKLTKAISGTV
jgi:hypothetical protein